MKFLDLEGLGLGIVDREVHHRDVPHYENQADAEKHGWIFLPVPTSDVEVVVVHSDAKLQVGAVLRQEQRPRIEVKICADGAWKSIETGYYATWISLGDANSKSPAIWRLLLEQLIEQYGEV